MILTGEPKSTQHAYGVTCSGGFARMYMKDISKNIKQAYAWEAAMQWRDAPLAVPFSLTLCAFHKTKRKQDVDNFNKLVLDALTGIVWKDDDLIHAMHLFKYVDAAYPRIELTIHTGVQIPH